MTLPNAKEFFNKRDKEITDRAIYGYHHDDTIVELMKEYARQVLDYAAETSESRPYGHDKQSILKIKKNLK